MRPSFQPADPAPVIRLTERQEAFCQAMAANVGGAEAARMAGYSPNGAKQRGAHLMSQPEIRVRVGQLRAERSGGHRADLEEAAELVRTIIGEALDKKSLSLALRAVELRLKLRGVIQDKRIAHHYIDPSHGGARHPDADLEDLDFDPAEDDDLPVVAAAPTPTIVTSDIDPAPAKVPVPAPALPPAFRPVAAAAAVTSGHGREGDRHRGDRAA
ncbi:hypothetical protein N825_16830 [Skermanella stibiiresistens SB22]|uniref:Terminase n=1 Tax=Skermanella stibiiresistens SB22 TaxID=1385369 RepID=W9GZ41_9PROT|nr:terminase small subunit [Skermanella stibiiresistens]EWY37717.1 hypothetical protein N825_16830 [Skermanella stibiiresistens SB22]